MRTGRLAKGCAVIVSLPVDTTSRNPKDEGDTPLSCSPFTLGALPYMAGQLDQSADAMARISFRIVKYGGRWYAQARALSWILRLPTVPFWRVIAHDSLKPGVSTLRKAHNELSLLYAHDTSEEAAQTISRFIDKLDEEEEKKRTRIEQVLPVEIVRRRARKH